MCKILHSFIKLKLINVSKLMSRDEISTNNMRLQLNKLRVLTMFNMAKVNPIRQAQISW